jgi:Holliday junction resolvase RusA-like endonuclease
VTAAHVDLLDAMCGALGLPDWPGPDPASILFACSLDITPFVKERARTYRTRGGKVRTVTPERTVQYEAALGWMLKPHIGGRRNMVDDLAVIAVFHLPTRRKADSDNLLKALMDACTGVVWRDDDQVATILSRRVRPSRPPRLDLCVYLADAPPSPATVA